MGVGIDHARDAVVARQVDHLRVRLHGGSAGADGLDPIALDDDDLVRGVLLWNVWDKTDEARKVLAEAHALTPDMLIGRITP